VNNDDTISRRDEGFDFVHDLVTDELTVRPVPRACDQEPEVCHQTGQKTTTCSYSSGSAPSSSRSSSQKRPSNRPPSSFVYATSNPARRENRLPSASPASTTSASCGSCSR